MTNTGLTARLSYPILLAVRDIQKMDRFYGTQVNLQHGRKRAKAASVQRASALRVLKMMETRPAQSR